MPNPPGLPDRILILGDEAKSARAIERVLVTAGYMASALSSFELARTQLRNHEVSLIIIEPAASRVMTSIAQHAEGEPGTSERMVDWARAALRFCEEVRSNRTCAEIPILVISKSPRAQDKVIWLNQGATDYISKPYQRGELLSRVKVHLRSSRYERERTERFEQLNVLHAVSSALASSLEPEVLVRGTLSALLSHTRASAGVVYLRDENGNDVSVVSTHGFDSGEQTTAALLDLHSSIAPLLDDAPLVLEPIPESLRSGHPADVLADVHGMVWAPIEFKNEQLGAVCLFSNRGTPFPRQRTEILAAICNQLSVALDNARLYVEARKSAAQLSFVYNLGNNLMTSLEMEELLSYAVFTVGKSLERDVCAVVVRPSTEGAGLASAIYTRLHGERSASTDWYSRERVTRYLDNQDCAIQPAIEIRHADLFLLDSNIMIETAVPLMFDDKLLGLLICASYSPRGISTDDQKLLGAVAQQLSLAIRNTELYRRTKDTSINLAVEVSKRTREAEEQKRFTEKIIDSLPVSLYVVDRDMRIVAWNRNRELGGLGINREQVLGRNVFNVLARQPRRVLEDEFTGVFRNGDMVRVEQESWFDGQRKIWKISKIPMRVDNAEVTHVITVGEDITEQKKMNEAVIHAEKLASIGRLAAGVVHEINNPLATIAACSEALTARVEDIDDASLNEDFGEYLQIIRDEAFRCKTITNSLLEFSHQRQAEKITTDVNQIIEQTLQLIKHHPKLGKLDLSKELDYSLTPVYVNGGQMKQIFIALISNAFDAMEGEGRLTIRTGWHDTETERAVCVQFSDTGSGIPAENLPKIFDPFFTTKPLGRGTGLGLSVCYGIVSEHGGRIEVDSIEGEGTTFRVLLPIDPEMAGQTQSGVFAETFEMEGAL
ncbi:MAG TPA: ATP-binding protein [Blastocatellia bacterium]|nr:ATP-binding protein [Blastocatellia bacterium]